MNIPKHIAIIMDGNGRWAKKKFLPKIMGHKEGVNALHRVVDGCIKFGVKFLTVYAFSTENWKRPRIEVKVLFGLFDKFLNTQMQLFHKNKVKLCIIGQRDKIDPKLMKKIELSEKDTSKYENLTLNIAVSYGGRTEIVDAVKKLIQDVKNGDVESETIDEALFSKYLYTKNSPDPDLLIRTSGEMRISNFLLWQISYAELYVTPTLWPDFGEEDLKEAIEEYSRRNRRYGR